MDGVHQVELRESAEGCIIAVRAQPGARRNGIVGVHGGALKVAISAPPDKGKANDAIVEVLAQALGLKRADVALFAGATSRDKRFLLRGLNGATLTKKLAAI